MGDDHEYDDDDDEKRRRASSAPRATFPIPKEEVLKAKAEAIAKSPATIGAGLGALCSLAVFPPALGLMGAIAALGGLGWYWRNRLRDVEAAVVADLVDERNDAQDKDLKRAVRTLRRYKRYPDANRLEAFLGIKRDVEAAMHACDRLSAEEVKLEGLVDTLCFEVKDELFRIADLHYALKKGRKRLSDERKEAMRDSIALLDARVAQAYETLQAARANLPGLVGASVRPEATAASNPVLDGAIEKLREETAMAKRVRERIEADMAAELAPWGRGSEEMFTTRTAVERA